MKPDRPVKKVSTKLDVLRFPVSDPGPIDVICLNCSRPLSLSQPDLDLPERLLGVCEWCKHWYLVELLADQRAGILLSLPEHHLIRDLSRKDREAESLA